MKYSIEIGKIVEGALSHNHKKMLNYSQQLIKNLESDNDLRTAEKFKKILNKSKNTSLNPMSTSSVPVDKESRLDLIDTYYPSTEDHKVILNDYNYYQLDSFIKSYQKKDDLKKAGIFSSNNLLLYGPPGTGKTQSAFHIAAELELPLLVAKLDSLISSYLGTTAKNIQTIFNYAENTPSVLLIDEFDAIAKARDDTNELGELKRVVNSLIQNIDSFSVDSILIVSTNHEKLLDEAIWRRFNYKIKIDLPDKNSIVDLIKYFNNKNFILSDDDLTELSHLFYGLSGADIQDILINTVKNNILYGKNQSLNSIYSEYFNHIGHNRTFTTSRENNKQKAKHLRNKDSKIFTYKRIGKILDLATSTVSLLIKED